jgi:Ca2+-binding RTX toxin-like protein
MLFFFFERRRAHDVRAPEVFAMTEILLKRPESGKKVTASDIPKNQEGMRLLLDFSMQEAAGAREGDDLIFRFPDGASLLLPNFYLGLTSENLPEFVVRGSPVSGEAFFETLGEHLTPPPLRASGRARFHPIEDEEPLYLAEGYGDVSARTDDGLLDGLDPGAATAGADTSFTYEAFMTALGAYLADAAPANAAGGKEGAEPDPPGGPNNPPVNPSDTFIDGTALNDVIFGDAVNPDWLAQHAPGSTGPAAVVEYLAGLNGQATVMPEDIINFLRDPSNQALVDGLAGNDTLRGNAGQDILYGGAGSDTLHGGEGDDALLGGGGNDVLDGGEGADTLYGGAGDDILVYGADNRIMDGESGLDFLLIGHNDAGSFLPAPAIQGIEIVVIGGDNLTLTNADSLREQLGIATGDSGGIRVDESQWHKESHPAADGGYYVAYANNIDDQLTILVQKTALEQGMG